MHEEQSQEAKILAKFQKLAQRNKPLYKKAFELISAITQVLQVSSLSSSLTLIGSKGRIGTHCLLRKSLLVNLIPWKQTRTWGISILLLCSTQYGQYRCYLEPAWSDILDNSWNIRNQPLKWPNNQIRSHCSLVLTPLENRVIVDVIQRWTDTESNQATTFIPSWQ